MTLTYKQYEYLTRNWCMMGKSLGMEEICDKCPSYEEFVNSMDENEEFHGFDISKFNRGRVAWNKGKKHSTETKRKISERTKGRKGNITMLGKKHSEETKAKMSASRKGKPATNKGRKWKQKKPNTKLSIIAKSRYKINLPNGKWTWGYRN